ncbi:MAG: adenine deaminase, partial [Chitinophagales bacterium]|nr:adenine deaminase [Chitinophagales bacterium]
MQIKSNYIDIFRQEFYPALISVEHGKIVSIEKTDGDFPHYILPGFVDAHVHIESSMLVPTEFA